jgi:hypothetical protein
MAPFSFPEEALMTQCSISVGCSMPAGHDGRCQDAGRSPIGVVGSCVLDRDLRRKLENAVMEARRVAEPAARNSLNELAVGHHEPWPTLSPAQRKLRNRLRAHGRQLGDRLDERKGTQTIDRLTGECAYEHWHRLLFARFLAENDLLVEPESRMPLSLDECRELAREQGKDWLVLASDFAQRMLPQIFRAGDPVLEVALPPEKRQELEAILEGLPRAVFTAEDSLGWVYQFWQAEQKKTINDAENKIGADELPPVTQLFTEDYMVLFLLHNTLGAWWAGKVLEAKPDLARKARSEDECRIACAVQGIEWSYLRFVRQGDTWRPAAGTFPGWPAAARNITVLDPCMGSGHFLAFALPMLVALRQAEEKLSVAEAVDGVLHDNLFGLELDPRCTQIAAFNVGLTAWKLAGYRPLPAMNLACAGLGINAPMAAWTALAAGDALAENAMRQLYELFRQAPTLGSLIEPTRVGGELFVAHFDKIRSLLSSALSSEVSENSELAVVAQGIARAASILAERYILVATNVPYLGRGDQVDQLADYCERFHPAAKADLATCFIERIARFTAEGGASAMVAPRNWMFLKSYKRFRENLLRDSRVAFLAALGPRAFETIGGEVVNVVLAGIEHRAPDPEDVLMAFDVGELREPNEKATAILTDSVGLVAQKDQLANPDSRLTLERHDSLPLLGRCAASFLGLGTGDYPRYGRQFWELPGPDSEWAYQQGSVEETNPWSGRENVVAWDPTINRVRGMTQADRDQIHNQDQSGQQAWGRRGVVVSLSSELRCSLYSGEKHDKSVAALVPKDEGLLPALWCYVTSEEFATKVRLLDRKVIVANGTLLKVPFEIERWKLDAATRFPLGLPKPSTDHPTQWLHAGTPLNSRSPLQVAVARLVGYEWPRMRGAAFADADVIRRDAIARHADNDGIVCLPALRGKAPAAERLRALLADVFGREWSAQKLNDLLAAADYGDKSLDDWLRDGFFEQHCALFRQRPFVWHIWDGRKDGFAALLNYHHLAAPNGEGRRTLDKLTHTYLGDWLDRQRADQKAGIEGADGRVAAAEHLKRELERVLEGEPPYDLFVRWRPLHEQPIGWEPNLKDGVRMNLRPLMTARPLGARAKDACVLRVTPGVRWGRDKGNESRRDRESYPWLWEWDERALDFLGNKEFDGVRWNDLHYSSATKLAARARANRGES